MQRYKKELFKRYGSMKTRIDVDVRGMRIGYRYVVTPCQLPTSANYVGKFDASWFYPTWRATHARMMSGITFARYHGRCSSCADAIRDCLRNCGFIRACFKKLPG